MDIQSPEFNNPFDAPYAFWQHPERTRCLLVAFDDEYEEQSLCYPAQDDETVMELVRHLYKVLRRHPDHDDFLIALTLWPDRTFNSGEAFACHEGDFALEMQNAPIDNALEMSGALSNHEDKDACVVSDSELADFDLDPDPQEPTIRRHKHRRIRRAFRCW